MRVGIALAVFAWAVAAYYSPAGERAAVRGATGSILPGGRVIQALGQQFPSGPGTFAVAISPSGRTIVSANLGPERASLTVMESDRKGTWTLHNLLGATADGGDKDDFRSLSYGLAFATEKTIWISEGERGLIRLLDLSTGAKKKLLDLNQAGISHSFAGALAYDAQRDLVFVLDPAHYRLAVFDAKRGSLIAALSTGLFPFALSLSPDGAKLWIANIGMSHSGDSSSERSSSVLAIDTTFPEKPRVLGWTRTGDPETTTAGSAPSAVLATADAVYVSNAHDDSIAILDPNTGRIRETILLRIPGLTSLQGVTPIGLALDETNGWLLIAEAGINAVGVVDRKNNRILGHLPAGWFPVALAVHNGIVAVANVRGQGVGPSSVMFQPDAFEFPGVLRRGSVSRFPLPAETEMAKQTHFVLAANGLLPSPPEATIPAPIRHVVLILKEHRALDEMLGDHKSSTEPFAGLARLASFGASGYADGGRSRFSLQKINVTPNLHALATRFAVSDNFYADSESRGDGHHAIQGAYPDAFSAWSLFAPDPHTAPARIDEHAPGFELMANHTTAMLPEKLPRNGDLWQHLTRCAVPFRNWGEALDGPGLLSEPLRSSTSREFPGFDLSIPDERRATQLIHELEASYAKPAKPLPQFLFIYLPGDRAAPPKPEAGYPYTASYIADNDLALGRIIQYFSHSPWWRDMAIFVTESDASGGRDHVDAHRTLLLGIGPYFKKDYVCHTNGSFPSLLKTIFRLLRITPLNLYDASASSLQSMLTSEPDFTPYQAIPPDERLFNPIARREYSGPVTP